MPLSFKEQLVARNEFEPGKYRDVFEVVKNVDTISSTENKSWEPGKLLELLLSAHKIAGQKCL